MDTFMEKDEMLEFYSSCRNKRTSGILNQEIADDSPLGFILQCIEMTGASKHKVDRELKKESLFFS